MMGDVTNVLKEARVTPAVLLNDYVRGRQHWLDVMFPSVVAYVLWGRPVGPFLRGVIANEPFQEVACRADGENALALPSWARLVVNVFPSRSQGDSVSYRNWIKQGGWEGRSGA